MMCERVQSKLFLLFWLQRMGNKLVVMSEVLSMLTLSAKSAGAAGGTCGTVG